MAEKWMPSASSVIQAVAYIVSFNVGRVDGCPHFHKLSMMYSIIAHLEPTSSFHQYRFEEYMDYKLNIIDLCSPTHRYNGIPSSLKAPP